MDPRLLALLAAPFIGSFLGVLVVRLPASRTVVWGRSACEACHRRLAARDMIPIVSFLALRGRCRSCGTPIGRLHLWIELAALAVAASAAIRAPGPGALWADCVLGWGLLALAWIDARTQLLPDALTLPLLLAGLAATYWLDPAALGNHALAALLGYGAFALIALVYRLLRGRDGLGGGDAKLLAVAGAWLGVAPLPWVVLVAALLGLAGAAVLAARGQVMRATTALPFGPFLALAIWIMRLG
jgi:leader peptidase (prepilin peptidase)/N-methyltransferase